MRGREEPTTRRAVACYFALLLIAAGVLAYYAFFSHGPLFHATALLSEQVHRDSGRVIEGARTASSHLPVAWHHTTSGGVPALFHAYLHSLGIVENSDTVDGRYPAENASRRLEYECGWDALTSEMKVPGCIAHIELDDRKIEELVDAALKDLDVVIPTIRHLSFLDAWRPQIEGLHVIIVQDGDPGAHIEVPGWVDYELYNHNDIEKTLGSSAWSMISRRDASIRNFGFLASKKRYIWTLDDDCYPINGVNVPRVHLRNLITNSTPSLFNTLYDPYRLNADFVRGYPYSRRVGVPTVISHGLWLNSPDYDAPTQLLKLTERNTHHVQATVTIPYHTFFPLCSMNVAFDTQLIGPAFMQGLMGTGQPWARYDDMFAGWASKVVADHLGLGVKSGMPYINHSKASNPFVNLKKEYLGIFWQEELIPWFEQVRLPADGLQTPEHAYLELAKMLRARFGTLHPYFLRLSRAMELWVKAWQDARTGTIVFSPSRRISKPISTYRIRRVAVFTVTRNEPFYLPLWVGYYKKHFNPRDIYVLDHESSDNSTSGLGVNIVPISNPLYFDHDWLVGQVQDLQQRLLSVMGYTHVLFAEVDEIIAPDPRVYPHGLRQYLEVFSAVHTRVLAYVIIERDDELPCDMTRHTSILAQRRWMVRIPQYDKPLLSTIPLHWVIGFHNSKEDVRTDTSLFMLHLQKACRSYALQRSLWKAAQKFHAGSTPGGAGSQHHLKDKAAFDRWYDGEDSSPVLHVPVGMLDPPLV